MAANAKGSVKTQAAPQSAAAASESVAAPCAKRITKNQSGALERSGSERRRPAALRAKLICQNHGGSFCDPGMRLPGYTSVLSNIRKNAMQRKPKAKKSPKPLSKKTLNPKRVMTGWSRGGSLALARRAAHDPLGRGATLPCGNPKP